MARSTFGDASPDTEVDRSSLGRLARLYLVLSEHRDHRPDSSRADELVGPIAQLVRAHA